MSSAPHEPFEPDGDSLVEPAGDSEELTRELALPPSALTDAERRARRKARRSGPGLAKGRAGRIRLGLAVALTGLLAFLLATGGEGSEQPAAQKSGGVLGATNEPSARALPLLEVAKGRPLTKGSKGPEVRKLQRALALLGFSPGKADGAYGERTRTAVAAFQLAYRLKPNGIVGRKTARTLNRVLTEVAAEGALSPTAS